ncbi:MAG: NADH-quinone oxidoreductase subunit J [Gemmatimonadetes bacterium]|nr:NADH-quinone oxidoreductase subunit J [Gemmatimonadota bacterium]
MSFEASIWYLVALLTLGTGAYVVFTRNIVRAAFALVFTFLGVAAMYVFLRADFLAAAQLLIYGGGITVLLLFGVMLTHRHEGMELKLDPLKALPAVAIAGGFFVAIWSAARRADWDLVAPVEPVGTSEAIGSAIMTTHLLPFEEISVLLLVVLIGALFVARRSGEEEGS